MKFVAARETKRMCALMLLLAVCMSLALPRARAQDASSQQGSQIDGIVRDSAGKAVADVSVHLLGENGPHSSQTKTSADGAFTFPAVRAGTYSVKLEKSGFQDASEDSIKLAPAEKKHCEFILRALAGSSPVSSNAIELDDRPNFTVAGVTDSSAGGGHGSETRMRTGEALADAARSLEGVEAKNGPPTLTGEAGPETLTSESELRAALLQNSRDYGANHRLGELYFHSGKYRESIPLLETAYQVDPNDYANAFDLVLALNHCGEFVQAREQVNQLLAQDKNLAKPEEANLRRTLGDLDEKLDDPLEAVRQYERAAGLDPSEQNYFAWGVELLLHKAAAPAIEVLGNGARLHPESSRMLAGLGAALYTSGSAEEGAQRLCEASDLDPSNPAPYLFLGKMQDATSTALPCAVEKLGRFVQDQPENVLANYYYAVALWKQNRGAESSEMLARSEALLRNASTIDPKFDLAYLQLGNLCFARGAFQDALAAYQKAASANPLSGEAHYRLGLTFKRIGKEADARREFERYKELTQTETEAIERQRRELRQFLFILKDPPKASTLN